MSAAYFLWFLRVFRAYGVSDIGSICWHALSQMTPFFPWSCIHAMIKCTLGQCWRWSVSLLQISSGLSNGFSSQYNQYYSWELSTDTGKKCLMCTNECRWVQPLLCEPTGSTRSIFSENIGSVCFWPGFNCAGHLPHFLEAYCFFLPSSGF